MGKLTKTRFTGTVNNTTYYVVNGVTLMRKKSSLTAKRVLKDKAFEKTRKHASNMGLASRLASPVYKAMPHDIRGRWLFLAITGDAASMLYEGKSEEEVKQYLWNKYINEPNSSKEEAINVNANNPYGSSKETRKKLWKIFLERWEAQDKPEHIFKRIWDKRGVFTPERIPQRKGVMPVV